MKIGLIAQARMGSSRLPGKMLFPLAGKPVVVHILERLSRCQNVDQVILATSTASADAPLVAWTEWLGMACFRGSEEDVLDRFYQAALQYELDVVGRVCADCPFIDPALIDAVVQHYLTLNTGGNKCDYLATFLDRTFPYGVDVEIFSFETLEKCHKDDIDLQSREGVTAHILTHQDQFQMANFSGDHDYGHHRWTLDTPDDFRLISKIYDTLYSIHPEFSWMDVIHLLEQHPEWSLLNAHVKQREIFLKQYRPSAKK